MISAAVLGCRRRGTPHLEAPVACGSTGNPTPWQALFDQLVQAVYGYVYAHIPYAPVAERVTEAVFADGWAHLQVGTGSNRGVLRRLYDGADAAIAGHPLRRSDALAPLTSIQQQVLLLRFAQRMEVAAIAELLGVDTDSVKRLQVQALRVVDRTARASQSRALLLGSASPQSEQ